MAPFDRLLYGTAKIVMTGELKVGSTIKLSNADNTNVRTWVWSLLPPDGSESFIANRVSSQASFKIDRPGAYAVRLRVNDGPHEAVDRTAVLVAEATPDPFAGALKLLEGATAYTGFVVAAQTQAGGTAVAARNTTAKLRARVDEQMALQDSGVARDDDEDRPHTAVAQLRELANWLRAQGESTKADDADDLAEAIAFKYEVL